MSQKLQLKEAKPDRDELWDCVRETVLIKCQFFPEDCGDAVIEMVKAHKRLFPERHQQE